MANACQTTQTVERQPEKLREIEKLSKRGAKKKKCREYIFMVECLPT